MADDIQYQTLLNDVSMQMAMSQLSQRRSQRSNIHSGAQARRSSRVEKAVINLSSPVAIGRRKTTSIARRRSASDDNLDSVPIPLDPRQMARANIAGRSRIERPITWHPSSQNFDDLAIASIQDPAYTYHQPHYTNQSGGHQNSYPTANWNTTMLQPLEDGYPSIPNTMVARYFPDQRPDDHHYRLPNAQPRELRMAAGMSAPSEVHNVQHFPTSRPPELVGWPAMQPTQSVILPCAPHQMDTQQSPYQTVINPNEYVQEPRPQHYSRDDKELVGMGLYDSPEDSSPFEFHLDQYQSLIFSTPRGRAGKGLKLEETWQPLVKDSLEENNDNGMDESTCGGYQEYFPNEADTAACFGGLHDYQAGQASGNFYFDNYDGILTNEWFLDQSESIQMQDPGFFGYDSFGRAEYQPYMC